jgi:hypothetical protein
MKKLISLLFIVHLNIVASVMTFTGVYQGKNVYIQNPQLDNKKDFCVEELYVNNTKVEMNTNVAVFEVNLSKLQIGDTLNIRLKHRTGCSPKLLNPHVIKQNSAFRFLLFTVTATNLTWQTRGEKLTAKIYIEQFLNNNWVVVHEMPAKGLSTQNEYVYHEFHCSGINKYRIKYEEQEGSIFYSQIVEFLSRKPRVSYYPKRITSIVKFSREVAYEVIDKEGGSVKKGYGNEIDMSDMKEGTYYLLFDNHKEKVSKK